jgi:hypothetical protein
MRYTVEANPDPKATRRFAVRDNRGNWVCSTHGKRAAAEARAATLNADAALTAEPNAKPWSAPNVLNEIAWTDAR